MRGRPRSTRSSPSSAQQVTTSGRPTKKQQCPENKGKYDGNGDEDGVFIISYKLTDQM